MPEDQPKQAQAEQPKSQPQACSLCSGQLLMDAHGTALFCDACWDRKWFLALESD
jgi:hypothetical protein